MLWEDISSVDGIAVDWVANNLYLTDTGRNVIEVARVDGSSRLVIIDVDIDEPRAIAVHPTKGLLFWSDWGKMPKIERSYLDGKNREAILSSNLGWPNGLTIDYDRDTIYWTDANLDRIEMSQLDGKHRRTILTDLPHPYGVTLGEKYIYWTDWVTKSIEKADKLTGHNREHVLSNIGDLKDLKMVSVGRQKGSNPCGVRNGGCSHLCLYRPHGYICACPIWTNTKYPCSDVPGEVTDDPLLWTSAPTEPRMTKPDNTLPSSSAEPTSNTTAIDPSSLNRHNSSSSCNDQSCAPVSPTLSGLYLFLSPILFIFIS